MKWLNCVKIRLILVVFVAAVVLGGLAKAATITVGPGAGYDFDTIQAGIDSANDGDEVLGGPANMSSPSRSHFMAKLLQVNRSQYQQLSLLFEVLHILPYPQRSERKSSRWPESAQSSICR